LSSRLADDGSNGLGRIEPTLITRPDTRHIVIGVLDCVSHRLDWTEDGERVTPTAAFAFIEPVTEPGSVQRLVDMLVAERMARMAPPEPTLEDAAEFEGDLDAAGVGLRLAQAQAQRDKIAWNLAGARLEDMIGQVVRVEP
jgi:hypothetical protein